MFHQFDVSETDRDVFGGLMVVLSSKSPRSTEWKCIRLGLFKRKKRTLQQQARCITHDFYVDDGLAALNPPSKQKTSSGELVKFARKVAFTFTNL